MILDTEISDVKIIIPKVFNDKRGYFFESYNKEELLKAGIKDQFVQDNQSKSSYGVLRGLHFQYPPYTQSKLVRVIKGSVLDVAVDIRTKSNTFGKYVAVELTDQNQKQLYIPRGFAHGFVVLSDEVIFTYKCDNFYNPKSEGGIAWNDPDINIPWKIDLTNIILSQKDANRKTLKEQNNLEGIF